VLKLVDDKLAILLLPDQALGNLPMMQREQIDNARCPIS